MESDAFDIEVENGRWPEDPESVVCELCWKDENHTALKHIVKKYGITTHDYNRLFDEQGGKCAICERHQTGIVKRLFIDHDHTTGKVRGLLCNRCNTAVGFVETSDVAKIQKYLRV